MEKFRLAARSAGISGARRRAVKNCLGGVSVFCARRSFIRRVVQVVCSSDTWRKCIWRVASVVELLPVRGAADLA
ncbi:hypothetical protein A2U01_0066810, partial [Trifolium medium]|nr:hypothetical protein [Trifolium medium]